VHAQHSRVPSCRPLTVPRYPRPCCTAAESQVCINMYIAKQQQAAAQPGLMGSSCATVSPTSQQVCEGLQLLGVPAHERERERERSLRTAAG
jgi:hypothetical protein